VLESWQLRAIVRDRRGQKRWSMNVVTYAKNKKYKLRRMAAGSRDYVDYVLRAGVGMPAESCGRLKL
jgi:hypothetical protein